MDTPLLCRPRLRLTSEPLESVDDSSSAGSTRWIIGGWPAIVTVWTEAEWAQLAEHPRDAQRCASGLWCRLRME